MGTAAFREPERDEIRQQPPLTHSPQSVRPNKVGRTECSRHLLKKRHLHLQKQQMSTSRLFLRTAGSWVVP
jgi:hypothetical protein